MIFWKHIKGFTEASIEGNLHSLYSFIQFATLSKHFDSNSVQDYLPEIIINTNNSVTGDDSVNCGHIMVSNIRKQTLPDLSIINDLFIQPTGTLTLQYGRNSEGNKQTARINIQDINSTTSQQILSWTNKQLLIGSDAYDLVLGHVPSADDASNIKNPIIYNGCLKAANYSGGEPKHNGGIYAWQISAINQCQASYFNATSDKRAKTDIKPLEFNALDFINNINLYSFKYKETETPSIGIIAQDIQNVDIDGFKLVTNEEASGVDMDYMAIHESKLIYILWKAIQEQNKEIQELKLKLGVM